MWEYKWVRNLGVAGLRSKQIKMVFKYPCNEQPYDWSFFFNLNKQEKKMKPKQSPSMFIKQRQPYLEKEKGTERKRK